MFLKNESWRQCPEFPGVLLVWIISLGLGTAVHCIKITYVHILYCNVNVCGRSVWFVKTSFSRRIGLEFHLNTFFTNKIMWMTFGVLLDGCWLVMVGCLYINAVVIMRRFCLHHTNDVKPVYYSPDVNDFWIQHKLPEEWLYKPWEMFHRRTLRNKTQNFILNTKWENRIHADVISYTDKDLTWKNVGIVRWMLLESIWHK